MPNASVPVAGAPLVIPTKSGATYVAKPAADDRVEIKGPDGKTQNMSLEEFKKFLIENVPQVNAGPEKDTFQKTEAKA